MPILHYVVKHLKQYGIYEISLDMYLTWGVRRPQSGQAQQFFFSHHVCILREMPKDLLSLRSEVFNNTLRQDTAPFRQRAPLLLHEELVARPRHTALHSRIQTCHVLGSHYLIRGHSSFKCSKSRKPMNYHLLKQKIIQFLRNMGILELIRPFYKIAGDRRYLYYFTQGHIVGLDLRERIKKFEKILFGQKKIMNSYVNESLNKDLALLKDEGIVRNLKIFSENEIKKLTNFLFQHEVFDPLDPDAKTFSSLTPRKGTGIAYYDQTVIVKAPCVMEKANHPYLMELVGNYFGCNFCLDAIHVWWSYPNSDTNGSLSNPQIFHRDLDALNFLKFFVYLTDVDEESGPHVFVQKISSSK